MVLMVWLFVDWQSIVKSAKASSKLWHTLSKQTVYAAKAVDDEGLRFSGGDENHKRLRWRMYGTTVGGSGSGRKVKKEQG